MGGVSEPMAGPPTFFLDASCFPLLLSGSSAGRTSLSSNSFYLLPTPTPGPDSPGYLAVRYDPMTEFSVSAFLPGLAYENSPDMILCNF